MSASFGRACRMQKFFWDGDRRRQLASRVPELRGIVFHARAGTMYDRARRLEKVAMVLAGDLGFDTERCGRAALLSKADLVTGIVGEFPELQGVMGSMYALHDGEDESVATAIRDHYKPLGPADRVPDSPTAIAVALADKLDSLVMLWRAGEKPTGSKDPFALRRAGLGIIRIILENGLRLSLLEAMYAVIIASRSDGEPARGAAGGAAQSRAFLPADKAAVSEVMTFLADRLKFALRDEGVRHDLIDAVLSVGNEDDFVQLVARVRALGEFLGSADGANLLVAYRRAMNILRIEEKRDARRYEGDANPKSVEAPEEKRLLSALATAEELISAQLERGRFAEAMAAMARLRQPVDDFFEKVTVNAADRAIRENRLLMLSRLRRVMHSAADFSRVEG